MVGWTPVRSELARPPAARHPPARPKHNFWSGFFHAKHRSWGLGGPGAQGPRRLHGDNTYLRFWGFQKMSKSDKNKWNLMETAQKATGRLSTDLNKDFERITEGNYNKSQLMLSSKGLARKSKGNGPGCSRAVFHCLLRGFKTEIYRKLPRRLQGRFPLIFNKDLMRKCTGNYLGGSRAICHWFQMRIS